MFFEWDPVFFWHTAQILGFIPFLSENITGILFNMFNTKRLANFSRILVVYIGSYFIFPIGYQHL